jgi:hypothetical protein
MSWQSREKQLARYTPLITLSLEHLRRARHTPIAAADPQPVAAGLSTTPSPQTGPGEILASHHYDRER